MVDHVRPGYVNPLTMMKNDRQVSPFHPSAVKEAKKKQKALETEKQAVQNSILLMKGTASDSVSSKENIESLEKKLEEITNELRAGKQEIPERVNAKDLQAEKTQIDRYCKTESEESAGRYGIVKADEGYRIVWDPMR